LDQAYKDRLLVGDKFESVASVSLSYWMIDAAQSFVLAAGVVTGTARMRGEIGGGISFTVIGRKGEHSGGPDQPDVLDYMEGQG
jgi:hypothetical protein